MLDDESLGDESSDWVDESADSTALEEANRCFELMSLSSPRNQSATKSKPEMENRAGFHDVKPLSRDVSNIPNWLLTQIEPGTQKEASKAEDHSDHFNQPPQSLRRSDTVPRWMLPHIRRNDDDNEVPLEPPQPSSAIKRKSVSWATDALHEHPPRPAPATPRFSLQNPNTPFHYPSSTPFPPPSQAPIDQEEAALNERLDQAVLNRDRNYEGAEGRRIEWEDRRRMSAEAEGWEAEVQQALEARERRGGPVAQWVKKEMRDKARDLWRKVKGTR